MTSFSRPGSRAGPASSPARIERFDCLPAEREEGFLLCRADLDRALTEEERVWFDTAQVWREPSPRRFLFVGASAHFFCPAGEEIAWISALAPHLESACSLRRDRSAQRPKSQPQP